MMSSSASSASASSLAGAGPPRGPPAPPMPPPDAVKNNHVHRTSDIFPSVPKSPSTMRSSKPVVNLGFGIKPGGGGGTTDAALMQSPSPSRPNAAITAAAVKSPLQSQQQPSHEFARRLDAALSPTDTAVAAKTTNRAKSAPPSRPPPPPPPLAPEDDLAVNKSNNAKGVSFQQPQSGSTPPSASAMATMMGGATAKKMPLKGTPHPSKQPTATTTAPEETGGLSSAGKTPYRSVATLSPEEEGGDADSISPPTTARRDLLRNMRAFADTPPEKQKSSRMMQQEETATASGAEKTVGFLSPVVIGKQKTPQKPGTPRAAGHKTRVATPHPKRSQPHPSTPEEERAFLQAAAECSAFEYGGYGAEFIVRRPYGLATESDLWLKAGQKVTKVYAREANVDDPSTLEVVAIVTAADQSLLTVYGAGQARHQPKVGRTTEFGIDDVLGSLTYIDKDANEKEYSLDELYEAATQVREHYCSIVRSTADGLRLRGLDGPMMVQQSPASAQDSPRNSSSATRVETQDKAVATDMVGSEQPPAAADKAEQKKPKPAPPPPEDSGPDILASAIQLFFSSIFSLVWFLVVGLPLRILTSTFVLAASAVLLSYLWLLLADDHGAGELGATVRMYTNQPGIM